MEDLIWTIQHLFLFTIWNGEGRPRPRVVTPRYFELEGYGSVAVLGENLYILDESDGVHAPTRTFSHRLVGENLEVTTGVSTYIHRWTQRR